MRAANLKGVAASDLFAVRIFVDVHNVVPFAGERGSPLQRRGVEAAPYALLYNLLAM